MKLNIITTELCETFKHKSKLEKQITDKLDLKFHKKLGDQILKLFFEGLWDTLDLQLFRDIKRTLK